MATQATQASHSDEASTDTAPRADVEAVVVGAGLAGVRMLAELKGLGFEAIAFEAGSDVGGTWYWNRYPGAATDSESWAYCYSFSEDLLQQWDWTKRYPSQPEAQAYVRFAVDRLGLEDMIQFNTKVESAVFDNVSALWTIATNDGKSIKTRYFITALGLLSHPYVPDIDGLSSFAGTTLMTARWPKNPVTFDDKRIGIIGSGSSAVQLLPNLAEAAGSVTVFQRTPNFVVPAQNYELSDEDRASFKKNYASIWETVNNHAFAFPMEPASRTFEDVPDPEKRARIFEEGWSAGGFHFLFDTFDDIIVDQRTNDEAAEFIRNKIRECQRRLKIDPFSTVEN